MNISETRLFNKKFKLYKNYSHHEKPNIKSLLDELTGRYTNNFSYYIIIDKHYINIYIKSKLYSLYKIIIKHYIYYLMDTYDDYLFNDDLNIYDSFYMTKNKIYNYIQHEDDNIIKYR